MQPRRILRFAYRGEDKKAPATASIVPVSRSHTGMIFRHDPLSADVPDNVSESRIGWRTASAVITGGRLPVYRITGHYPMVVSVGRGR